MKKVIFTVLIVALAMLTVTCDSAGMPMRTSGETNQKTPGSEGEFVTITIGTSSDRARAMTLTQAAAAIDFYEVVFQTPTAVVRSTADVSAGVITPDGGASGNPWTVNVPIGMYDGGANKAVLFAGRKSDKTLLAVGIITGNPAITIGSRITFTLYAIRSGVDLNGDDSYFKITRPYRTSGVFPNDSVVPAPDTATISAVNYPAFIIPHETDSPEITATYRFNVTNEEYVQITAAPALKKSGITGITTELTGITISESSGSFPRNFPGGGFFTLAMSTKTLTFDNTVPANNLTAFSISVPVIAITDAAGIGTARVDWFIKGGLDNDDLDAGGDSPGGAVLLKLTNLTGSEIVPTGP